MLVVMLLILNLSDTVFSLRKHNWWQPLPKCGPYEVASFCARTCPPQSCDSLYYEYLCAETTYCNPGCNCIDNYLRNDLGVCIPIEQCYTANQQCSDPNASPENCPSSCQPTCDQPNTEDIICTRQCLPGGCVCNPGYILNATRGTCIKKEKCPKKPSQKCSDPNASPKRCPSSCQPTCDQPNTEDISCTRQCLPGGCVCNPGYILNATRGTCIKKEKCPKKPSQKCSDPNASPQKCPSSCQPTCDQPNTEDIICTQQCLPGGCVCNPGFILNATRGTCIKKENCPKKPNQQCSDPNASPENCPSSCQPTCDQPNTEDIICNRQCLPGGCVCNPGYILNATRGTCIKKEECPKKPPKCNGDPNAMVFECPTSCPSTCDRPDTSSEPCIAMCDPSGCMCKAGYILSKIGGKCILPHECPGGAPKCSGNKTFTGCYVDCPNRYCPGDNSDALVICDPMFPCPPGCGCVNGYLMLNSEDRRCVLASECPPIQCTRPNEIWDPTPLNCNRERCEDINVDTECEDLSTGPPKCVCEPGYYRDSNNVCVPASECGKCNGDPNAVSTPCATACAPTCADPDASNRLCNEVCSISGCQCKTGFILSEIGGQCIKPEICPGGIPSCGKNKTYVDCFIGCPTNYCPIDDRQAMFACSIASPCPPGCACNPGYMMLSFDDQRCVKSSECPPINCTRPNEVWDSAPSICYSESCEDPKTDCSDNPGPPRCVCQRGFYRNKDNICVPASECDTGCNGDPNAIRSACASYCPPTCDEPSSFGKVCIDACDPIGCECKPGYILTKYPNGKCIKAEECPGGSPSCGANKTYLECFAGCPTNYCPSDDSRALVACDIGFPCPPGCACNPGYLMLSYDDQRCVKSSECPPINCTRPNEVWNPNPSNCYSESCKDMNSVCSIKYPSPPRCVCKAGFYRNEKDICVPASECDTGCDGDPNAMPHSCPSFCPPTCDAPSTRGKSCIYACDPRGCVCKPGYILTKLKGKCVKHGECPAKPLLCGLNEVAVKSRTICPPQNCEIAYTDYDCSNYKNISEPGCDCLPNYLRNGSGVCILNDECPYPTSPICGVNEIARDCRKICPPQTCLSRLALYKCRSDIPCEPGCDCIPNYLRNSKGVCIPADKCESIEPNHPSCSVSDKCIRTCASPNPANCPYKPPKTNKDGCECMEGYILSKKGGKCIRIEDCPSNITCNGDPHARAKRCPLSCPSTCDSPNATPCKKACEPIACECEPGYLFSKLGGKCILPDECPGGNPCPKNSEFRQCKYNCPQDYCPEDENTDSIVCDPWPVCLSGCVCRLNHRRLSYENDTCVVASECPPVNCTRPNEVWDGCPSDCFSGYCADREYQDNPCNTFVLNCQPKCVCMRDTFRNASGICVPASECPPLSCVPDID